MKHFTTDFEHVLWEMLYRSQTALAIMCLEECNRNREEDNDWPAGQKWHHLAGSSKAIFARTARKKARINHTDYLEILKENIDALETAESISDEFDDPWDF